MARKKYQFDLAKIARFTAEGRGKGELASYKPWLFVQDVPSRGRRHRRLGKKTGRIHHLMSDIERNLFVMLDEDPNVYDIREQFPLDRNLTERIAARMAVKHPATIDGHPNVMTTDFLVVYLTPSNRFVRAFAVKPSGELDKRTREKLEIERRYWKERQVPWGLLTDSDVIDTFVTNVRALAPCYELTFSQEPYQGCFSELADYLSYAFEPLPDVSLAEWCTAVDSIFGIPEGSALTVMKHLLSRHLAFTDLNEPQPIEQRSLGNFSFARRPGKGPIT